jgi:hypothetical protein
MKRTLFIGITAIVVGLTGTAAHANAQRAPITQNTTTLVCEGMSQYVLEKHLVLWIKDGTVKTNKGGAFPILKEIGNVTRMKDRSILWTGTIGDPDGDAFYMSEPGPTPTNPKGWTYRCIDLNHEPPEN